MFPLIDPRPSKKIPDLPTVPPIHEGKCVVCGDTVVLEVISEHRTCVEVGRQALGFLEEYEKGILEGILERTNYSVELVVRNRRLVFIGRGSRRRGDSKRRLQKALKKARGIKPRRRKKGRKR